MLWVSKITRLAICRFFSVPAEGRHLVSTIYNGVPDGLGARKVAKGPVVTIGHVAAHKNPATWIRATGYVIGRAATPPDFI